VNRFTAYAVGDVEVNGELVEVTFDQEVGTNPGTNEYILLSTITSVGNFSLHVKEGSGTMVHNSFKNSPLKLTISAGATSPETTFADVPSTIPEGATNFLVTFSFLDEYGNPTSSDDILLSYYWGDDEVERDMLFDKDTSTAKVVKEQEGTSLLYIFLNGETIRGSPFSVTTEKERLTMPGSATFVLVISIVSAGLQIFFFCILITCFRDVNFVRRQGHFTNLISVYSGFDWFLDMYFVSACFRRGYGTFGNLGVVILVCNAVVNIIAMAKIIQKERLRNNVDLVSWKQSGFYVGMVEFLALNHIGLLRYLPWENTPFKGYASRHMFALCTIIPLLTENAPQLILQVMFIFEAAEVEGYQIISMATTALSIILNILTSTSFIFLFDNKTVLAPSRSNRELDLNELSKDELVDKIIDLRNRNDQLNRNLAEYHVGVNLDSQRNTLNKKLKTGVAGVGKIVKKGRSNTTKITPQQLE